MWVSVKEFQTYDLHISDDVKDYDEMNHNSWIVPAVFNPLHFKKISSVFWMMICLSRLCKTHKDKLVSNLCKICFQRIPRT